MRSIHRPAVVATAVGALLLAASMAGAVVGNPVALTEAAEAQELKGQFTTAAKTRQRAIDYAERTVNKLKGEPQTTTNKRDMAMAQSVLAENKRWRAEDNAGGGKLKHVKEEMTLVAGKLEEAKSAEARYQRAKRAKDGTERDALAKAVAAREGFIRTLGSKITTLTSAVKKRERGYEIRQVELDYYKGVLARWQWSLAVLKAGG